MNNKKYFFLCGLPRSGNTLLASLINQNPDFIVTANSIIPTLFHAIKPVYDTKEFLTFPNYKSLDNVVRNLFTNYYQNFDCRIIIDRGPWGTPGNLEFLKRLNMNSKFIVLKRPILEILASFIRIENHKTTTDIEKRCHELMSINGMIGKYYWSYKNLLESEDVLLIDYDNLCLKPQNTIESVYKFLNEKPYNHSYQEISQLKINGITYDDSVWLGEYHTLKTNVIAKEVYNFNEYLPESIIKEYKGLD